MFREFRELYPEVSLEIQEYGTMQTRQQVQNDQLDAAFVILDDTTEKDFHCIPIMETQLVLTVDRKNPLSGMTSVNLEKLREVPLVLMKEDSYQNAEIKKRFHQVGISPDVILYSGQIYTIKQFVHYNNVGAFLFQDIVENDPELVGIPCEPPISIRIGIIWKRSKYTSKAAQNFIHFTGDYHFK
jgi:DNA-binding transcriptional LysR family regulator